MKIRIVNKSGYTHDTQVIDELGNQVKGITSVVIKRLSNPSLPVEAEITFEFLELDLAATAHVTLRQLRKLADQHGMKVAPR